MRWSIRNQILIPLAAIQGLAIVTTAAVTAGLSATRSERELVQRLDGVSATIAAANFPLTEGVLTRMRDLSGAHFVALGEGGRIVASTNPLPQDPSLPALTTLPATDRLSRLNTVDLDGQRFVAARLRRTAARGSESLVVLYPASELRRARWEAAMPPLALGAAALLLSSLATGWAASRAGARVRRLQQQVAMIADGHFEEVPPGRPDDELADLAISVNRMTRQLGDMRSTIERGERARLLAQLGAGLAHQLRNAVAGARLSVQLHMRRCAGATGDESLVVALRQLELLEEQVRGLLSLGRNGAAKRQPCDVATLLSEVALLLSPACRHAGVRLEAPELSEPLEVEADAAALRAAVLNLALNAIEAAGAGGIVSLDATLEPGSVQIEVADSGQGPPAELADALFDPFVTGKPEGVGLGLALARRFASEHDGTLQWDRHNDRTRFLLTLPLHTAREHAQA